MILITGGVGYIGSHTAVELLEQGKQVVILDNLSNSSEQALTRIEDITGSMPIFIKGDIRDRQLLSRIFDDYPIDSVIHFAALKAVGESVSKPLSYYNNNILGTISLLEAMSEAGVKNMVFSSSATVYGVPEYVPLDEQHSLSATNPYGQTKLMMEQVLRDLAYADDSWNIVLLRYFNPIGAHSSGLIGEDPSDIPNNLLPYVTQVAIGKLACLQVFGSDYDTHDGTGVRDYIHVVDLAKGHVKALEQIATNCGLQTYNLGTGQGYSVLDIVKAFERVTGQAVAYELSERRPGDIAECFANPEYAEKQLGWKAEFGLERMLEDSWRWQSNNPDGYTS